MATTVAEFLGALSSRVPLDKAAGWDPVGLQVGDPESALGRVAVAHELTSEAVAASLDAGVGLVVAYHPLLFRPTNRFVAGSSAEGRAYRLATRGVSVAVVHTAFDVLPGGAADALAGALDLEETSGFGPLWPGDSVKVVVFTPEAAARAVAEAMTAAGAGRIGPYSACSFRAAGIGSFHAPRSARPVAGSAGMMNEEPEMRLEMIAPKSSADAVVAAAVAAHPYEEPAFDVVDMAGNAGFVGRIGSASARSLGEWGAFVGKRLEAAVRIAGDLESDIGTVAVVPGSGASLLGLAAGRADMIVTGDVSHHRAREALEGGLAVVDAGHIPTERPGVRALYALVSEIEPSAVDLSGVDAHPWKET